MSSRFGPVHFTAADLSVKVVDKDFLVVQAPSHRLLGQVGVEQYPLQPLEDLAGRLGSIVNGSALSIAYAGNTPEQCGRTPEPPTELLDVPDLLSNDHSMAGLVVVPVRCNTQYHVIASLKDLNRKQSNEIKQTPFDIPFYCYYFPSTLRTISSLRASSFATHVAEKGRNSPLVYLVDRMVNLFEKVFGQREDCATRGDFPPFPNHTQSLLYNGYTGFTDCVELCFALQQENNGNDMCTAASFSPIKQTCLIYSHRVRHTFELMQSRKSRLSYLVDSYFTVSWLAGCGLKGVRYDTPELLFNGEVIKVSDNCTLLNSTEQDRFTMGKLGRVSSGLKTEAQIFMTDVLSEVAKLENESEQEPHQGEPDAVRLPPPTPASEGSGGRVKRRARLHPRDARHQLERTARPDQHNRFRGPRSAQPEALYDKVIDATQKARQGWAQIEYRDSKAALTRGNILQTMRNVIESHGQKARIFLQKNHSLTSLAVKMGKFAARCIELSDNHSIPIHLSEMKSLFERAQKFVSELLTNPAPAKIKLNDTKTYIFNPSIIRKAGDLFLQRRYLSNGIPKSDVRNVMYGRFPLTNETYQKYPVRVVVGGVTAVDRCLIYTGPAHCPTARPRQNGDIIRISFPFDAKDGELIAINRPEFVYAVQCNGFPPSRYRTYGWALFALPTGCSFHVDGEEIRLAGVTIPAGDYRRLWVTNHTFQAVQQTSLKELVYRKMAKLDRAVLKQKNVLFGSLGVIVGVILLAVVCLLVCGNVKRRPSHDNTEISLPEQETLMQQNNELHFSPRAGSIRRFSGPTEN